MSAPSRADRAAGQLDLKNALAPYTLGGPWGRLLDAESEASADGAVQAFETEGLLGTPPRRRCWPISFTASSAIWMVGRP
jgi:type IV secretory pathway VirB4 component